MPLIDELKMLVEDGYSIADQRGLVGLKKKIYRSNERGFDSKDNNFGHMAAQSAFENQYEKWFSEATKTLKSHGLQASKFRIVADTFDPEKESNLPAQRFIRRLKTLEKLIEDEIYRKQFISSQHLPEVRFIKGLLTQGENEHRPENDISELISLCWSNRGIRPYRNAEIFSRKPKPITRAFLQERLSISHERMVGLSSAINSIRKHKGIEIWLRYPKDEGVYLEVCQSNE